MAIVRWIALVFGGLFVLIFLVGMFVTGLLNDPPKSLPERATASCQKEYASTPGLIDQCVLSIMQRRVEELLEAKAQRAYNGSR